MHRLVYIILTRVCSGERVNVGRGYGGGGLHVAAAPSGGRGSLRHLAPILLEPARHHPPPGCFQIQVGNN